MSDTLLALRARLDRIGVLLSGLCLIHCVAGLFLVGMLGLGGGVLLNPDIHRWGLAFALARLSHDDHSATPFGVFRDVDRGDYGHMVGAQLAAASERKGPGDLAALLRSNGTWMVGGG